MCVFYVFIRAATITFRMKVGGWEEAHVTSLFVENAVWVKPNSSPSFLHAPSFLSLCLFVLIFFNSWDEPVVFQMPLSNEKKSWFWLTNFTFIILKWNVCFLVINSWKTLSGLGFSKQLFEHDIKTSLFFKRLDWICFF